MHGLEALVRDTLASRDVGKANVDQIRARLRARIARRRRATIAGLGALAALVVVAGVAIAQRPDHHATTVVTATTRTVDASMQVVSYRGVEAHVPADWTINNTRCGTPMVNTVMTQDGPVPACLVRQPPNLTVLYLSGVSPYDDRAAIATTPTTVDGHPALRGTGTHGQDPTVLDVLVVPDIGVIAAAESPDPATRTKLIDDLHIVDVDSVGCTTHVASLTPPGPGTGTSSLITDPPATGSICRYSGNALVKSIALTPAQLDALVAILDSLPDGGAPSTTAPYGPNDLCRSEPMRGFIIHLVASDGTPTDVYVHISDCDQSARTTTRNAQVSPALVQNLTNIAGYDGGISRGTLN
jgi:hypothetical protein